MTRVAQLSLASAAGAVEQRTELRELGFDVNTKRQYPSPRTTASCQKCIDGTVEHLSSISHHHEHTIRSPCHSYADSNLLLTNHPPMPVDLSRPVRRMDTGTTLGTADCLQCQVGWLSNPSWTRGL